MPTTEPPASSIAVSAVGSSSPTGTGFWYLYDDTDMLTGIRAQSMILEAFDYDIAGDYGDSAAPGLMLLCEDNYLSVAVLTPGEYVSAPFDQDFVNVAYRIGDNDIVYDVTIEGATNEGVWMWDGASFTDALLADGDSLVFRIFDWDDLAQATAHFDLSGMSDQITHLTECGFG